MDGRAVTVADLKILAERVSEAESKLAAICKAAHITFNESGEAVPDEEKGEPK